MPTKPLTFPLLVKSGSVTVKIYKVRHKSRLSLMVDYIANGRRQQKMFASLAEARAEANVKAQQLSRGELDVLPISHAEGLTYLRAAEANTASGRFCGASAMIDIRRQSGLALTLPYHGRGDQPEGAVTFHSAFRLERGSRCFAGRRLIAGGDSGSCLAWHSSIGMQRRERGRG